MPRQKTPTITDSLYDAWTRAHERGLSFEDLAERSGVALTRWQLSRKLRGTAPWRLDEAVAVARALGLEVVAKKVRP